MAPRSITIAAGVAAGSATVTAVDDTEVEQGEVIALAASHGATPIGAGSITISANDRTAFSIAVDPAGASIAEGETATVTVHTGGVTFATEQTIELTLGGDATAGTDYTITTRSITIVTGATAGTTTVEALEDTEVEPAETITISAAIDATPIGSRNNGHHRGQRSTGVQHCRGPGRGRHRGGRPSRRRRFSTVSTGGVTFATRQTVALDFTGSTAGADDYLVVPANILLAAGATLGTATITVVNDRVVETRETIVVTAGHDSTPLGSATISIPPNDQPDFGLAVSSDTIAEGESVVVTVTTGGVTFAEDQTIELDLGGSATAGSDYTVTPSDITLRAGATAGSATIRAVDDSEVEERETITITATHDGTAIAAAAAVTISASDRTAFRLTVDPAAATIAEGESAVVTVTTGGVTFADDQTIELDLGGSATAGSDYTVTPSDITLRAGATAGSATIRAVDDSEVEERETIAIAATHHGAAIAAAAAVTISASDRTAFRLTVDPAAATIAEGESAVLTVTTGGVTFADDQIIELDLGGSATAGSDYTMAPSDITIAAGAMAGTATITAVDDSEAEDSETIAIVARHESTPIGTVAVTIGANDEGATPRDETGPAVMIGSAAELPANGPFTVSIEFSESVSGLALAEIEVSNGTAAELTGAGASYRATITPRADYEGEVTVTVSADAAVDADGNGNVAGSASFKVDTRAPTVTEATLEQPLRDWTEPTVSGAGSAGGVVQYLDGSGNRAAAQRNGAAAAPGEASGDGHEELTLTWDEALDETSTPAAGAFTVRVDGERRALTGVTVRGRTVRLGLAQPAQPGQSVTVSYTAPAGAAGSPIRDLAGNAAEDVSGAAVSGGAAAEAAGEREAYARVNRALLPNLVGALQASTQEAIGERELAAGGLSLAGRPVAGPETAGAGPWQEQQTAAGEPWEEPAAVRNIGVRELLEGSSFVLPLAVGGAGGEARADSGGGVALWGRGDYRRLASGEEAEVEWSGGLLSVHVGPTCGWCRSCWREWR